MKNNRTDTMTVLGHLGELRKRIFVSLIAFIVTVLFSFYYVDFLRMLLVAPADGLSLVYFSPPEAFMANIRLALISGFFLAFPVFLYEILAFVFPGLYRHEKKFVLGVLIGALFLFISGVLFAYYIVLQLILHFFLNFQTGLLTPMFNITSYISFIMTILFVFGIFFQLPLVMWVLGKLNLVSSFFLRKSRKFAILIMLVAAALITPPDVISQIMLVGPLAVLYEAGILLVILTEKKRIKQQKLEGIYVEEDE